MTQLRATPTHHHMRQRPFVSSDLSRCTHVFVRQDVVCLTLEEPYHIPQKVMKRGAKTLTVDVNGKQEVILLDCLKPAHIQDSGTINITATDDTLLPPSPAVLTPQPMRTTCSVQHVQWPDQYVP